VQVAWTRLPALRALVGDKYYPDSTAYQGRGMADLFNFVFNPELSLANFYAAERAPAREKDFHETSRALKAAATTAAALEGAVPAPAPAAGERPAGRDEDPPGGVGGTEEDPAGPPSSDDERERLALARTTPEPIETASTAGDEAPPSPPASPASRSRRRRMA
jgi:hypothetical protein